MNEERKEEFDGNTEGGVSLREICRIIGKKIWCVLAGAVLVTIAAVLLFTYALNPAKQYKNMSFQIDYPMSDNGKYPDGSLFDYRDMVSREVIAEALKDKKFASLNADKVINGGVSISAQQILNEVDTPYYIYTVSLKSSCFDGVAAEDFISALTDAFVKVVIERKADELDYKLNKEIFNSASYKNQLLLLTEQKDVIVKQYDEWIKEYNAGHVVEVEQGEKKEKKSLSVFRTEVMTTLADTVKTPIENDLTTKGYEYFNEGVDVENIKIRVKQLLEELEFDKAVLEELRESYTNVSSQAAQLDSGISTYASSSGDDNSDSSGSGGSIIIMPSGDSNLSQRMAYYSERYAIVKQQITYLTSKSDTLKGKAADEITENDVENANFDKMVKLIQDFGDNLSRQFGELEKRAGTLTEVIREIYRRDTVIIFNARSASSEGGTSTLIVGAGAFVVSFIVFAVVAYFVGRSGKSKKNKPAPEAESGDSEKNE